MNRADESLLLYRDAWGATQHMLELARSGDWDGLITAEAQRASLLDQIQKLDTDAQIHASHAEMKAEMIRGILAMDKETLALSQGRMEEIKGALGSNGVQKKLQQAYGSGGG